MATRQYMTNRIKWSRPQGLLFADNPGTVDNNFYVPQGTEGENFIIVSDHNRESISVSKNRIEQRKRMINGSMRSYHTADKVNLSTSWARLPSRSFSANPVFDSQGNLDQGQVFRDEQNSQGLLGYSPEVYTADGGAGGADLLEWYDNNPGPFWVYVSYDKFGEGEMNRYTQVLQMYFSSFDYEVEKRGQSWGSGTASGYDMWNVSLALEEV